MKFITSKVQQLLKNEEVLKISKNIGWLFFDKVLRMGVGLFIGVWIARYLGPEQYGLWNYAIAFTAIFGAMATLGLDSIAVRDLSSNPQNNNQIIGTVFALKLLSGIVMFFLPLLMAYFFHSSHHDTLFIIAITSLQFVFLATDVIDFFFQSKVNSKYTIIAKNISFLIFAIVKVFLLTHDGTLIYFVYCATGEVVLSSILLLVAYQFNKQTLKVWNANWVLARSMLKQGLPLVMSGFIIIIYMKVDQIMLGEMLGNKEVGEYAAALKLSEIWYMVPSIIIGSIYPSLVIFNNENSIRFHRRLQQLFAIMLWLGILLSVFFLFSSDLIISLIYGEKYKIAADVLKIHIFSSIPVFYGSVWSSWIIIEKKQNILILFHSTAMVINILLNYLFIKYFGVVGPAYATVIGYSVGFMIGITLYRPAFNINIFLNCFRPSLILNNK